MSKFLISNYHFCCLKNYSRIDIFIRQQIPHYSRSFLQKNILQLSVNHRSQKISHPLKKGDEIKFCLKESVTKPPHPLYQKIITVYEDEEIIVFNKPAGILSHPKNENTFNNDSIAEYIQNKISKQNWSVPKYRWGIVHRLDRETSGLMICTKNNLALEKLKEQFQNRNVIKKYFALVNGNVVQGSGEINKKIGKDPRYPMKKKVTPHGKDAITFYKVVERFNDFTLVDINLLTGRTHQIRVHFFDFNHFVIGDKFYGKGNYENLFLCCYFLEFQHPLNNKTLSFQIAMPDFFEEKIKKLNNNLN